MINLLKKFFLHSKLNNVSKQKRLIHVVKKNSHSPLGIFEDINIDLGKFIEANQDKCDPMIKMAYAYARRTAVSGLFFQGIVGENLVKHVQDVFIGCQRITGQTIEFQEIAAAQACEFIETYIPQLNFERQIVLGNYAKEGMTALEITKKLDFGLEIDQSQEVFSVEKCLEVIDQVFNISEKLEMNLVRTSEPKSQKRLIDIVEKKSQAKLGDFAKMADDVRASSEKYIGDDLLFAAAGHALILSACGAYVAGGVSPKLISDYFQVAKVLMANCDEDDLDLQQNAKAQAFSLASTYVLNLTPNAAEKIIKVGSKLETFVTDGEGRISPEEVVNRAKK